MEENVSPELSLAPEQSQDPMDSSAQGVSEETVDQEPGEDASQEKLEDIENSAKATSETRKTWGFRRTTIAKREMPGDPAPESQEGRGAVRRSGRQAKRTDKLEEFLLTTKRGRPAGRRSGSACLEGGDPPSQTPTDVETASEASFDGNTDVKSVDDKPERKTRSRSQNKTPGKAKGGRGRGASVSDDGSSENEHEEEEVSGDTPTKPQPQSQDQGQPQDKEEDQEKPSPEEGKMESTTQLQPEQDSVKKEVEEREKKEDKEKEQETEEEQATEEKESDEKPKETSGMRASLRTYSKATNKGSTPLKGDVMPKVGPKTSKAQEEIDNDSEDDEESLSSSSSSSSESDDSGYDPNALYCICRQKHNKRFMICCDRCFEWFHGDCVGITEARGRLMERNGEDYVCPNCTTKMSQVTMSATSSPAAGTENGKPKAITAPGSCKAEPSPSVAAFSPTASAGTEEKGVDDLGIKGRIEKATNPSGKKKIKIFQPQQTVEESSLPKCIGPGCDRNALPDSVYCGNDCILRHAAAAMKSITDVKEPKRKNKPKTLKRPGPSTTPKKCSTPGKKTSKKSTDEEESDSDEDDDDEEQHAEERPPPPAMSSWSSDHNYNAVTPEKTTPISPTVLNKTSAPEEEEEEESEDEQKEKEPVPPEKKSPASTAPPKGVKKSPGPKGGKTATKGKKSSTPFSSAKSSKKQLTPPSKTAKSKKPVPPPAPIPTNPAAGPLHATGALRVTKSTFTIPKKQPHALPPQKDSPAHSQSSSSRVPASPISASSSSSSSQSQSASSRPPQPAASAPPLPPMAPPNNQMRQNIRRSLTDILYKRVSDSDDLNMSESEVGKLAVSIEKEMFGLCLNTDSKYKNKYRSLMFNLKDPKNKGLFYRVVWGDVSPFRLVRLSAEELLSKEISEWRKPDSTEVQSSSARPQIGQPKTGHRKEAGPPDVDMEEAPPMSDGDVCISATSPSPRMAYMADQEESSSAVSSGSAQGSAAGVKSSSAMPDIFSTMLKDTTSEHRAHLFDLNCKICTGQRSADDEPATKKPKLSKKPEVRPEVRSRQELRPSRSFSGEGLQVSHPVNATPYSEPLPPGEEMSSLVPPSQTPAPVITQAVSSVSTITRRDPRMARHSSGVTVTHSVQEVVASMLLPVSAETPAVAVAVEVVPKGPLPMPPAPPPSIPRPILQKAASSASEPPPEGETAIFLSGQEMMWKGFVNMHSVAKFVTKAYMVSGSFEHLKEDLPDTIHIGGRISPSTVWDYVGKLKTSLSKELCLIRFHPATEEEEVAYVSLFSYFSSRKRFGVVANNNRRIKDLYLIPLSSKDPLPSKLLPFEGPGLEPARPNLLLGLVICQKDKKRAGTSLESEEKRSKTLNRDLDDTGLLKTTIKAEGKGSRHSQDLQFSTTPPGSPPPLSSSEASSSSLAASSVLSFLSAVKAPGTSTGKDSPSSSSSAASSAANATPLQTILKTLFGKKKQDSEASLSPSDQSAEVSAPPTTLLDPIVQQFGQISKEKQVEEDEDDRPYDPEEEYDPSMGYTVPKKLIQMVKDPEVINQPQGLSSEVDDVAYDPEDDTIFEDVKTEVPGHAKATPGGSATGLTEQQKMLDDINKQIEVEKRQLEEQEESIRQQRSTTGTSAALFSVTDTLITQTTKSLLANSQLLQLGKKVEELVKSSAVPLINQRRDPRQSRDPRRRTTDIVEKEEVLAPVAETTPPSQSTPPQQFVAEQQPETPLPQEEVLTDAVPFLESDTTEVSIPLLGEHMEPDMEVNYMEECNVKNEEVKPTKVETEMDKYSIWPNAASILKAGEIAGFEQNSQESTSSTYFNITTNITSTALPTIPVLSSNVSQVSTTLGDTQSPHTSHLGPPGFHSDYRAPLDIPPPTTFPPQLAPPPMQGPPPMLVPPHMSVPPSMQGPPPMTGRPRPIQGEGDKSQYSQYGPPPGAYPPYQNQWGGSQQQPPPVPPPQTIMPPRGPPPPFQPMDQRAPPPQMFNAPMGSIPPQHMGQRGPPPGQFIEGHNLSPHTFDGQNSLPPPRFTGPPPPFNYPGPRGPPPPFTGPPPGHFDTRLPPPSHFPGPSGPPPTHFGDHGSQPSNIDPSRGPVDQYKNDSAGSYQQGMDQHQGQTPHMYKDNQAPPPGAPYRGPPHNQYEGRRGPPPSEDMSDQRFHPHNQFGSSRAPSSPPPHRSSFDDQRGPPPPDHRGPPSQHFGGPQRYRLDSHPDDPRPARHSGPLLPTPPDGPIHLPNRMGGHSPDSHRDEHWRRHSPDMRRRRSSPTREGSEPHSGDRPSRFEGGHRDREPLPGSSRLSEERQRDLSEDRRRDRDREGPHGGRPWDRSQGKRWSREREWDRGRERDRERERSRERDRSRGREGDRHREPEGERHRDPEADKRRERERERDRERDRGREREPERRDHDRDRARNRDRERDRDRDRERDRDKDNRDRRRDRSRSRDRDRGKDRDRDRARDRDRERDRERDRDRRDRSRSKEKRDDKKDNKPDVPKDSDKSSEVENDKNTS